jgi:hypothetical protein
MIFRWLLPGLAIVGISYMIPSDRTELWPALNVAGLVAAVYLILLLIYFLRSAMTTRRRTLIAISSVVVSAAIAYSWMGLDARSHYQQKTLMQIHSVIIRGIVQAEVGFRILDVLDDYHKQTSEKKMSLWDVFKQKHPEANLGANIYKPEFEQDSMRVFVAGYSDTSIVLIAHHPFGRGREREFVSYTGRKGSIQERFILTERGVRHETDN